MARKGQQQSKRRWRPFALNPMKLERKVSNIRFYAEQIKFSVYKHDINVDYLYDQLFQNVEELYGILELDKLALDNADRHKEVKERVRKAHG